MTRALLAVAVIVIVGCGCGFSGLSKRDLQEFQHLHRQVTAMCKAAEPRQVPTSKLRTRLDRMLELARKDPGHWYDSDPTNDPSIEDDSFPSVDLIELAGLMLGHEGPPACNKGQGRWLELEANKLD